MTPAPPAVHVRRKLWIGFAGLVAIFGLVADYWLWRQRLPDVHAVVIATIADRSAAKDQAFCEGLEAEIADTLARAPRMKVGLAGSGGAAGDALLESILERSDGRMMLIAQLTRPSDGHRYWSKSFSRPLREAALLPLDVARAIARVPEESSKGKPHLPAFQAFETYIAGRSHYGHDRLDDAVQAFERATQADPDFARAWAWLAVAQTRRVALECLRPNEAMPEARDAAEHAVAVGPTSAVGHLALGIVRLQYDWEWDAAKSELDRAVQLAPGSALAAEWRRRWDMAVLHTQGGDAPAFPEPANDEYRAAWKAAGEGNSGPVRKFLEDAEDIRVEIYIPASAVALLALRTHDFDAMFQWLNIAYDERSPVLPYFYLASGFPIGDPRYGELLARMKLPAGKSGVSK